MRQVTTITNVYKFDELSEKAKANALSLLRDINVEYEWWEFTCDDAERIGLKIEGFDTYRGEIEGKLTEDTVDVAKNILREHGEICETYKLAKNFLYERDEEEFERAIKKEYLSMLANEYDYLTSDEAIIETIQENDYEFTESGKLY